jgi:hypothetical protein
MGDLQIACNLELPPNVLHLSHVITYDNYNL